MSIRFLISAAVLFIMPTGPRPAHAVKAVPDPETLPAVQQKRILIIDDMTWNEFHEVPKEASLEIYRAFDSTIHWAAFGVVESALGATLDTLNNYDVVVLNYCDNLWNAVGTPFETALKQWMAAGNRGIMGYHTSFVNFYGQGPDWPWFTDSVSSTRNIEKTGPHTQGTLSLTTDASLREAPILKDLEPAIELGDVWATFDTASGTAAPTWKDCKVLYTHQENGFPQVWIREDALGNRFFFSFQFHDTEHGTESDFNYNLLLRATEYVAGERAGASSVEGSGRFAPSMAYGNHGRPLMVDSDGSYGLSVLSLTGKLLYSAAGAGKKALSPPAFQRAGLYFIRLESGGNRTFQRILIR